MGQVIQEWAKQNLWKTAFKKIEVKKKLKWYGIPYGIPYHFNFFKGCLPQIFLCPLNTLTHTRNVSMEKNMQKIYTQYYFHTTFIFARKKPRNRDL